MPFLMGDPINCSPSELSIYLQELAEEYSPISCLGIAPSVPLRSIPIASWCLCNGRQKATCPGSPSLETSRNLTLRPGVDMSIASQVGFPARTFPPLAKEQGFLALAQAYGQSSPVSLARCDLATHSLKTPQRLLFEGSTASLQTLPPWGWMHAGVVSGLMTSVPGIKGSGRGFLPTATQDSVTMRRTRYAQGGMPLTALLPTPQAADRKHYRLPCLTASMQTMADFLQAQYAGNDPERPTYAAAKQLPTPRAQERQQHNSHPLLESHHAPATKGSLNPTWGGWYMGWPMDWEALPGTSQTLLTSAAFLRWLREYQIALNGLWHSAMARCRFAQPWPGAF